MKTNSTKNWMKVAGLTLAIGAFAFTANAQRTTSTGASTDFGKQTAAAFGASGQSIRVIDNKGTIKYLQASNGLTILTDKTPNGGFVETWQLGGTLTDNATIVASSGKEIQLNGLALVPFSAAATSATDRANGGGTGWTVLVRDETTGTVQKVLMSDLMQVQAGQAVVTVGATASSTVITATTPEITLATNIPTSDVNKISVYRNGAKLVAGADYSYTNPKVTLKPSVSTYGDWALYDGDVIEVQWVK